METDNTFQCSMHFRTLKSISPALTTTTAAITNDKFKCKFRHWTGKYKFGARAGKHKLGQGRGPGLGAMARAGSEAKGWGLGNTKTLSNTLTCLRLSEYVNAVIS